MKTEWKPEEKPKNFGRAIRQHPPAGGFKPKNGPKARGIGWEIEMSPTLTTDCDACSIAVVQMLEGIE